jgi:hypothetical protein
MCVTIVQERVVLLSPAGATTVFTADGDDVVITDVYPDSNGLEERTTLEGAHEVFNYLFDQGWR